MSKIENHKLDCYHYKDSKAVGCCCVCAGVGERVWVWVHSHSSLFAGVSFITRSHQVGKEPRRGLVCACVYVLIRLMRAHQSLAITKLSFHFSPSLTPVIYHAVGLFLHMQIISQVKRHSHAHDEPMQAATFSNWWQEKVSFAAKSPHPKFLANISKLAPQNLWFW